LAVKLYKEPELENPVMIACWPGIGNVGVMAVDTLRVALEAEEFGEIEPWDFFYPKKAVIRDGELKDLEFPACKFYYKRTGTQDLIFFVAEEQPTEAGKTYAEGTKAYRMANLVLDVAVKFGCVRVYTSGAAVAPVHHTARSRVWAVPNNEELTGEVSRYENTVLMSDIEGRRGQGNITGLNGLVLGVAKRRGIEAICVMGEVPVYFQGLPFHYPKASKSVLEVLTAVLGISIELGGIEALIERSERDIELLYETLPAEMKEQLDRFRDATHAETSEPGPITDEDKKRILEDIDQFFKKGSGEDET